MIMMERFFDSNPRFHLALRYTEYASFLPKFQKTPLTESHLTGPACFADREGLVLQIVREKIPADQPCSLS